MKASYVGVHVAEAYRTPRACPRCGRRRQVKGERASSTGMCRDCYDFAVEHGELHLWGAA